MDIIYTVLRIGVIYANIRYFTSDEARTRCGQAIGRLVAVLQVYFIVDTFFYILQKIL